MPLNTLHDLMVAELKDLYSAETQLVRALPKMMRGAANENLKTALSDHLGQTKEHVSRLEQIFESLDESPRGKKCKAMEGLVEEGSEMVQEEGEDTVRDAGIIASAQRVEHYEMAAYGSSIAFARQMGHEDIVKILEQTLSEEKAADQLLSALAEKEINVAADSTGNDDENEGADSDDDDEKGDKAVKSSSRGSAAASRDAAAPARKDSMKFAAKPGTKSPSRTAAAANSGSAKRSPVKTGKSKSALSGRR